MNFHKSDEIKHFLSEAGRSESECIFFSILSEQIKLEG